MKQTKAIYSPLCSKQKKISKATVKHSSPRMVGRTFRL